jgi:hypothetical protein
MSSSFAIAIGLAMARRSGDVFGAGEADRFQVSHELIARPCNVDM